MSPPQDIRQPGSFHHAGADAGTPLGGSPGLSSLNQSASSLDAHLPPSPEQQRAIPSSGLSSAARAPDSRTPTPSPGASANTLRAASLEPLSSASLPHSSAQAPPPRATFNQPTTAGNAALQPTVSPQPPPATQPATQPIASHGINRKELFQQRQAQVLAIGRSLERERHAKHATTTHHASAQRGLLTRMLQALGLLGGSAPVLVGPQTILDRLISFIAATLKKFDQAIFGSGEEVPLQPTAPLQRATTIEERERKARGESETDTGIPLSEKEGPTTGRG